MNNAVIQELIKLKFRFADQVIETFPEPVKQTVKHREYELLTVVNEMVRERLTEKETSGAGGAKEKAKMNSVSIE